MNVDLLWSNFLSQIKNDLSSLSFDTWFADTQLYSLTDDKAYIIVPMPIHKKHLKDNYYNIISETLFKLTNTNYDIIFILKEEIEKEVPQKIEEIIDDDKNESFVINSNLF